MSVRILGGPRRYCEGSADTADTVPIADTLRIADAVHVADTVHIANTADAADTANPANPANPADTVHTAGSVVSWRYLAQRSRGRALRGHQAAVHAA